MSLLFLIIINLLLMAGMVFLPSLRGEGLGHIYSRAWLIFGLLVFAAHYLQYLDQTRKKGRQNELRAHRQFVRFHVRNS